MEREGGALTPWTAGLAGRVQAQSGQRVIERSILQEEKTNEDSARYWLARATYYVGRKEDQPAREAFEKALALALTSGAGDRGNLVQDYARYLGGQSEEDAVEFLRTESGRQGLTGDARQLALGLLLEHCYWRYHRSGKQIAGDDALVWDTLSQKIRWGQGERDCLASMLGGSGETRPPETSAVMERAEKLCQGADPSRAATLGQICIQHGYPERAVPLLRDAAARLTDEYERDVANAALLRAYISLGYAAEADAQLQFAIRLLSRDELPDYISQIAVVAAKSGDGEHAMRLWRQVANTDATFVLPVRNLAAAGLKDELERFYRDQQAADPDSWVPPAMLYRLSLPLTTENWAEFEAN
jgi:tetratricopeptide (TPR) repeat protein